MEGKSASQTEMISMSRPSRERNRASSKNLRSGGGTRDSAPPNPHLPSKKSQIRASASAGASPRGTPASKKAKTGSESLAGAAAGAGLAGRAKKPESSSGRGHKSSSRRDESPRAAVVGVASRSKRAAERNGGGGGDVTLDDALRPAKTRKISGVGDGGVSSRQVTSSPGLDGGINSGTQAASSAPPAAATATAVGGKAFPDSPLRSPKSGVDGGGGGGGGSAGAAATTAVDIANAGGGHPGSEASGQIGGKAAGVVPNGVADGELSEGRAPAAAAPGPEPEERRESRRDLRPRPQLTAPKVKKRTRFHEVTLRDGDGPRIVGRRIKVFWPLEKRFFYGHVKAFNGTRKLQHKIVYDDKDEEWLRLQNEVFGIELLAGEVFGSPPPLQTTTTSIAAAAATTSASFLDEEEEASAAPNDLSELDDASQHAGASVAAADDDGGADAIAAEPVEAAASPSVALAEGSSRIKPEGVYRRKRKAAERASEAEEEEQRQEKQVERNEDSQQKKGKKAAATKSHPETGGLAAMHRPEKKGRSEGRKGGGADRQQNRKGERLGDGMEKGHAGDVEKKKKTERGREGTGDGAKAKGPEDMGKGKGKERAGGVVGLRKEKGGQVVEDEGEQKKQEQQQGEEVNDKQTKRQRQRGASAEKLGRAANAKSGGNSGPRPRDRRKRGAGVVQAVFSRREKAEGKAKKAPPAIMAAEGSSSSSSSASSRSSRRRLERERVRKGGGHTNNSGSSSARPRTRTHSNSIFQEREAAAAAEDKGPKKETRQRRRIGDDDGSVLPAAKSSGGIKVSQKQNEKQHKKLSSTNEGPGVVATLPRRPAVSDDASDKIRILESVDGKKPVSAFDSNRKPTVQTSSQPSYGDGQRGVANASGPFDAVMDAYREALSGTTKDSPPKSSTPANHGSEDDHRHSAEEAVRKEDDDAAFAANANDDTVPSQDREDENEEEGLRGGGPDLTGQLEVATESPSIAGHLQHENLSFLAAGGAEAAETEAEPSAAAEAAVAALQHPDVVVGGDAGRELVDGEEEMGVEEAEEGRRIIVGEAEAEEVSTTEVVLSPLISPPVAHRHHHLRPEIGNSPPPDKVFRRLKKYQPDKVYRRLKHSGNKVPKNGVVVDDDDEQPAARLPQILMLVPQYWSLARPFFPAAHHGLSHGGDLEPGPRSWSVEPANPPAAAAERGGSWCKEVGTYYGRRTLHSFLRVTRSESSQTNADSAPAPRYDDSRDVVLFAAGERVAADAGPVIAENSHQAAGPSPRSDEREESRKSAGMDDGEEEEPEWFVGPWLIDVSVAGRVALWSGSAARARWMSAVGRRLVREPSSRAADVADRDGAGPGPLAPFHGSVSSPVLFAGEDAGRSGEALRRRNEPYAAVQGADLDAEGRVIGAHYGSPSIRSLLRVSADFWCRLAAAMLRWAEQSANEACTPIAVDAGAIPGHVSTAEATAVTEPTNRGDGMPVASGGGAGQEPSAAGDDLESVKASSRAFGLLKKGRRTGTGLKRGFAQSGGDNVGKDALPGDRFPEGDPLSGRPISKRTKMEIDSSDAALTRDNGAAIASPPSDTDRKSFATPSSSATQERATASSGLPRMNILKLRRCPTNKGVWLVAGNSCTAPPDARIRAGGADTEPSSAANLRDLGSAEEPMTPICEPSKKRMPEHISEPPSMGRIDHFGSFGTTDTPAGANTVSSADSQDAEIMAAKGLNSNSPEVWFDCGITTMHGSVRDGLDSRKRRRKCPSPVAGEDVEGSAEHSGRRPTKAGWGACTANLLITKSDRCVRETGAVVDLQSSHGNSYMLTVSLHGDSKYAVKADQPIATGTSNKFTHSMMWRGGKAWSLEFVDRKQWQSFKDLHDECFQRNARAASVRHIPIPGVKPIQECPKSGHRFVRPPLKYIRQVDGEVEMAISSARVIYDMDSEDEEWLAQVNGEKASARGTRSRLKVDEDTLERVMDKLEKTSFIQQHEPISAEVGTELCQGLGSQDVIRSIYGYWSEKRQRRGMGLIRLFQPPPWERYQKQLQDWQAKIDQLQQQSPSATKHQLQSLHARPPLFAFCLRPRGLENRNKMQKQRSQRKQGLGGSSSRQWSVGGTPTDFALDSPSRRQPGFDNASASLHGSRKFFRQRVQDDAFSDPMAVDLTESFNAIASEGFAPSPDVVGQDPVEGTAVVFPQVDMSSALRFEASSAADLKRAKKLGRKGKKMKLIAAAEESRRKRQLRPHQAHPNGGRFVGGLQSPHPRSDLSPFTTANNSSTGAIPPAHANDEYEDTVAKAVAAEALAKSKREAATALRSRAQALHAIADAAMQKAVAAVIAADAVHAAERAAEEASSDKDRAHPVGNHRQPTGEVPVTVRDDLSTPVWGGAGGPSAAGGGTSFGSWRRALSSASKNANRLLSRGSSSSAAKPPGLMTDMDDALLPVASWSQELGAGLGTRLLQKAGEASPPRQRHSPVLVEGLSKSPARGVRGEGSLVSLGRTRGESMMAMLTR